MVDVGEIDALFAARSFLCHRVGAPFRRTATARTTVLRRDAWSASTKAAQKQRAAAGNQAAEIFRHAATAARPARRALKKLIRAAKKRGYVTHDQINSVAEEVDSEQIENILTLFSEIGVNVVETEETGEDKDSTRTSTRSLRATAASWSRSSTRSRPSPKPRSQPPVPTIPCACTCARWARWNSFHAKAKSPSPSASRPGARR